MEMPRTLARLGIQVYALRLMHIHGAFFGLSFANATERLSEHSCLHRTAPHNTMQHIIYALAQFPVVTVPSLALVNV